MTTSQEFIIQKLEKLVDKIPQIKVRYEYDDFLKGHYVEVMPHIHYKKNDSYIQQELAIYEEFVSLFPRESLAFLSESDLYEIELPIYEKTGKYYDLLISFESVSSMSICSISTFSTGVKTEAKGMICISLAA